MRPLLIPLALLSIPCLAGSLQLNPLALDPAQFRVTEFATNLTFPLGMVQLSDASGIRRGRIGGYFSARANLLRAAYCGASA